MPAAIIPDLNALTRPIGGDDGPAGPPLALPELSKLDKARTHIEADPRDPFVVAKPADWDVIIESGQKLLQSTSKDFLVVARLVEALTKKHAFAGTRVGLELLARIVDECWDRMHPRLKDGKAEARGSILRWLDDAAGGAWFPVALRQTALLQGESPRSWNDYQAGASAGNSPFWADASRAKQSDLLQTHADLNGALAAVDQLEAALKQPNRMGNDATPLRNIRSALNDCRSAMEAVIEKLVPKAPASTTETGKSSNPTPPSPPVPTRAHLYAALRNAADELAKMEPHSPVPFLVRRAVELGSKDFPEMIKSFMKDQNILKELYRELGITETK
jgi:type VI secretion system protein ImpA